MTFSEHDSLVLLALIVAVAALLAAAQFVRIPYPILLVVGGLALALVPGIPSIALPPDLVLIALLPPLLYGLAFFTSLRDLRENMGAITLLAVGLVLMTMLVVAAAAHAVVGLDWPSAFVLGAVLSPTDPTAVTAIAERIGIPRRIVAVIEGESLVNDGTALVAYKFAVAAVVSGSFSLADAAGSFALNVVGGIAIGLGVGFVIRAIRRRLDDAPTEITISLLSGYFAFLPAHAAGVSGVLAAVTVGIFMGWHTPELTTAQTRLQGIAVWEIVFFVLNATLFALVGLQLPVILEALSSSRSNAQLLGYAALVTAAVIAARFLWVVPGTYLTAWYRRNKRSIPNPGRSSIVIGWSGMRGAVSLAAALAIPLTTDAGGPFRSRALIIFLTFSVILATLVFQGLTLPGVVAVLGLEDEGRMEKEEAKARLFAAEAALARLEELAEEEWVREDTLDRLRGFFNFRRERFRSRFDPESDGAVEDRSLAYQRLMRELLDAERAAVFDLRRARRIDDEVMRRVVRDLDLEEARLDG
jgi:Na+/H+ antiporter